MTWASDGRAMRQRMKTALRKKRIDPEAATLKTVEEVSDQPGHKVLTVSVERIEMHNSNKINQWEQSVKRAIGRDVASNDHGTAVFVPCRACGETKEVALPKVMSPEGVRRKMETEGWDLRARRRCPVCAEPKPKEEPEVSTEPKLTVVPAAPDKVPTDAARAMRRAILQWLDEGYDVANQRYRPTISDASIAKEMTAPVALIKQMREEFYGPASEPPELVDLRHELVAIQTEARETRDQFDTKMSGLHGRMKAVETRLGKLADRNGWQL